MIGPSSPRQEFTRLSNIFLFESISGVGIGKDPRRVLSSKLKKGISQLENANKERGFSSNPLKLMGKSSMEFAKTFLYVKKADKFATLLSNIASLKPIENQLSKVNIGSGKAATILKTGCKGTQFVLKTALAPLPLLALAPKVTAFVLSVPRNAFREGSFKKAMEMFGKDMKQLLLTPLKGIEKLATRTPVAMIASAVVGAALTSNPVSASLVLGLLTVSLLSLAVSTTAKAYLAGKGAQNSDTLKNFSLGNAMTKVLDEAMKSDPSLKAVLKGAKSRCKNMNPDAALKHIQSNFPQPREEGISNLIGQLELMSKDHNVDPSKEKELKSQLKSTLMKKAAMESVKQFGESLPQVMLGGVIFGAFIVPTLFAEIGESLAIIDGKVEVGELDIKFYNKGHLAMGGANAFLSSKVGLTNKEREKAEERKEAGQAETEGEANADGDVDIDLDLDA